jgi:serine/threonine-protein kinase
MPGDDCDAGMLAALDAYCEGLRLGQAPDRGELLKHHPSLAGMLGCLEDLQRMASTISPPRPESDEQSDAATVPPTAAADGEVLSPSGVRQFGHYELLGLLGRGGMGVVYKARQKELDRTVALKMILANEFTSPDQLRRFQAEARAAAGLSHPHVLPIYEAGCVNGQHFFTMRHVEGPSLAGLLSQEPLSPEAAARCLLAVARAVAYLHEHGIIHRDLKPANILLANGDAKSGHDTPSAGSFDIAPRQSFFPYVTDFGLVKMLEGRSDLTCTGAIVGTPSYMAPEQAAGHNLEVGPLSDVYSLGAILYEMLTGRPPFREATPFDTLVQVIESEPTLPHELNAKVPRELELVCLKALDKKPELRYASASALADDIERFLRGETVHARPQDIRQRLMRWARQEPGLVARLGTLGASAGIAQAYYSFAHQVPLLYHLAIQSILVLWALVSIACQWFLRRDRHVDRIRKIWLTLDAVMLTAVLIVDGAHYSALALLYGVFIAGSGLWFRTSIVWYTTILACLGYTILVFAGIPTQGLSDSPQHHVIVLAGLAIMGWMVAAQVERVRVLSRYYEKRPMP